MIIGAIIIGIFILALITLGIHISKECDDSFDIGVFIGIIIAILMFIEICLFGCITEKQKPSALDVYRGNTELEITSVNGVPIDTVVVFKRK